MNRVIIFANKKWEVEPILNALLNYKIRPTRLNDPDTLNYPWAFNQGSAEPRAIYDLSHITVELWCIQDVLDNKWHPSSSQGKNEDIKKVFAYQKENPSLVISCGTAGFGNENLNNNGCVVIGCDIFVHNFHPNGSNSDSIWDDSSNFEKLIRSKVDQNFFDLIDESLKKSMAEMFLKPFLNPSENIKLIISKEVPGLSNVNITDNNDYNIADHEGIREMIKKGLRSPDSVETTHGVVRLQSESPFIFISGITDRLGHFNDDVLGQDLNGNLKKEAQNYTVSFNMGVCLSWLIPKIEDYFNR